jgi:hypothetical protein
MPPASSSRRQFRRASAARVVRAATGLYQSGYWPAIFAPPFPAPFLRDSFRGARFRAAIRAEIGLRDASALMRNGRPPMLKIAVS